ncbi:hypothetical protein L3V83_10615 [Thiotrichales bacterium 19X7-9]|nr:hypothetical protein [Thiotrichales bacterium 19X7-9]
MKIIQIFILSILFIYSNVYASANYKVQIFNRSAYSVDIKKDSTTCINSISGLPFSIEGLKNNNLQNGLFNFEDKNTWAGTCDGAEKEVDLSLNFIGAGRSAGIVKIEHKKNNNGKWSTKVSSASSVIKVTSAACYTEDNKSHNCRDTWFESSDDLTIKMDVNVDAATPPPHPIAGDTSPVSIGLGDITFYDGFGKKTQFDDIKSATSGHYSVHFSKTLQRCTIVGNSSSIGAYLVCGDGIDFRTVQQKQGNTTVDRLVFLCVQDKKNEDPCPLINEGTQLVNSYNIFG